MKLLILRGTDTERAAEAGGPLAEQPGILEQLKAGVVAAVALDGKIVAYWPIWVAVHAEPLWVAPEHRSPQVIRGVIQALQQALAEEQVPSAFAIIGHADQAVSLPPALKLGFERVQGDLYYVNREQFGGARDGSSSDAGDQSGSGVLRQPQRQEAVPAESAEARHDDDGPPRLSEGPL
jgi:hypothetical protein